MAKGTISFGAFTFPNNPESLRIEDGWRVVEQQRPDGGSVFQNLGAQRRIVTCEGAFYGAGAQQSFSSLKTALSAGAATFVSDETGSIQAQPVALSMTIPSDPGRICYSFTLWEIPSGSVCYKGASI